MIADGDSTLRYVLFSTSHDGTGAINALPTSVLQVRSPITVISGYNGTGKSTLLQLAAAAYRHDDGHYSVADFIIRGTLDAMPFLDDASVEFTFETRRVTM